MEKRGTVQTELTTEELHSRYRRATNAVERTHWQIVWQMKEGHTPEEIASMLGYTARWVRTIVRRWNTAGEQGICERRLTQPGAPRLLTVKQQRELDHLLDQPPADGGLWSGPNVAGWMQEYLGRPVDPRRGWDDVQPLGRSTRVPRPQHEQSDEATQQAFKKTPRGGGEAAPGVSRSQQ